MAKFEEVTNDYYVLKPWKMHNKFIIELKKDNIAGYADYFAMHLWIRKTNEIKKEYIGGFYIGDRNWKPGMNDHTHRINYIDQRRFSNINDVQSRAIEILNKLGYLDR